MEICTLVDKVNQYLETKYEVKHISRMKYTVDDTSHKLEWSMNQADRPYIMSGDFLTEDSFFKYVCKEIDNKRIYLKQVHTIVRTDHEGNI